jgi:enterochelin esterase-like enzyme
MHGSGDVFSSWISAGAANVILDNLIAQHRAVPMIVVMPYNGSNYPHLPLTRPAGSGATFNVGLKHAELFSQFGLFSAGFLKAEAASRHPEFADAKAAEAKFDLLWISGGSQHTDLAGIEDFVAIISVKHTLVTCDGGHVWPVWRWSLAEFAPLLFRKN